MTLIRPDLRLAALILFAGFAALALGTACSGDRGAQGSAELQATLAYYAMPG